MSHRILYTQRPRSLLLPMSTIHQNMLLMLQWLQISIQILRAWRLKSLFLPVCQTTLIWATHTKRLVLCRISTKILPGILSYSVADPDPQGSASFGRIRIRIIWPDPDPHPKFFMPRPQNWHLNNLFIVEKYCE
jgi:hypothetical protein